MTARIGPTSLQTVDGFSGPQVCAIVGITYRQLDYWARTHLVEPRRNSNGPGTYRDYDTRSLLLIGVVKALLDGGCSLQRARRAVDELAERPLDGAHVVLTPDRTAIVYDAASIVDYLLHESGVLTILSVDRVRAGLDFGVLA